MERLRSVSTPGRPLAGSPLLGTLLNEHPDCASIGAAVGLPRRPDLNTYLCSCGVRFRDCEFWQDIAARTASLGHPVNVFESGFWNTHLRLSRNPTLTASLARSLGSNGLDDARDAMVRRVPGARAAIERMGWNSWSLARAVLDRTGKSVFVDTSRDHQRPKYLAMHPQLEQSGDPPNWHGVMRVCRSADTQSVVCAKMHSSGDDGGSRYASSSGRGICSLVNRSRSIFN